VRMLDKARLRLRSLFRRRSVERELDFELRFHLDQLVEENIAAGSEPHEARRAALLAMGGITQFQEECRDMRRINFMDDLLRDLRYAGRSLRRNPGFAALAVLIMALGIGANTAVFSVVNAVLLKPLSYRDPDRIVTLTNPSTTRTALVPTSVKAVSIPNFQDWHDQSSSFEAMAYYQSFEASVMTGSEAEYAQATKVSPEFFRVLAIEPVVGHAFTSEELKMGGGAVMISYSYWQSHFGADVRALGQTVRGLGKPLLIAGVLPPGFRFPDKTDLWYPVNTVARERTAAFRGAQNYFAIGRLKQDVPLERAQAEMAAIAARLARLYPEINNDRTVAVTRMRDEMVGDVRLTLYLLLGAVSVVLLIACANTATLLLGKASARTREIAVRIALGAGQRRIVRQLTTESLVLALVAGAAGLALAYAGTKALVALGPANLPRLAESSIDRRVLAFTFGISILTGVLFGLVPAISALKLGVNGALKQGGTRSVLGGAMARMRETLVVAEIALAVVLLSGAGVLIKSFVALHNVILGFRPENVLVMKTTMPAPTPAVRQFFRDILPQVSALPGVAAAGAINALPGHVQSMGPYFVEHMPPKPDLISAPSAAITILTPGALAALGIPLQSGRDFNDNDSTGKPLVAVVNQALARKSLPGQDPIGRTVFCLYDSSQPMTIIGVAGDVHNRGPAQDPIPECYIPYQQHDFGSLNVVARTAGDPTALGGAMRRLVRQRAANVSIKFGTLESDVSENVAAPRFRTLLFGVFAGLAVCLAMAGVYGVMSYAVGQRSNEIGLRIALGASQGTVLRLILGEGLVLAAAGLALGLAGAIAGTRLLTSVLFRVKPNDPPTYFAVAVLLGFVTLLAGYIPARRAAGVDPVTALRQE
jgi:putative ABC transport system permease protein